MNRALYMLLILATTLLSACEQKEETQEDVVEFQSNRYYQIYKAEKRQLRTNLFIQLANKSDEIEVAKFNIFIDTKFMLSTEVEKGEGQVYGIRIRPGDKKIIIETENIGIVKEAEFELAGRQYIDAVLVDTPTQSSKNEIIINEVEEYRQIGWHRR